MKPEYIWSLLTLACLAGLAGLGFGLFVRLRTRRLLQRIENMLESALAGDFRESDFDETQLSKLESMLFRFLSAGATSEKNLLQEKERISALVSDISHQTKTPVANIRLYTELLEERSGLPPEAAEMTAQIRFQSEKLEFLIQSLVKASRLENGIVSVKPVRQDCTVLLTELCRIYGPLAERKSIDLQNGASGSHMAAFDYKWTLEAAGNIVDNAIKYTPAGGTVRLDLTEYELFLCITVTDTGIGITEAELPRLFERFYRSPQNARIQGVGLGLYLTREIVTQEGGYIRVRAAETGGSEFSVFLKK